MLTSSVTEFMFSQMNFEATTVLSFKIPFGTSHCQSRFLFAIQLVSNLLSFEKRLRLVFRPFENCFFSWVRIFAKPFLIFAQNKNIFDFQETEAAMECLMVIDKNDLNISMGALSSHIIMQFGRETKISSFEHCVVVVSLFLLFVLVHD